MPQQPSSTLFPYTTLFRSHSQCDIKNMHCGQNECCLTVSHAQPHDSVVNMAFIGKKWGLSFRNTQNNNPEDRKSTRLNSSHLVISYAVFCLKKKKIARIIT